MIRMAVKRSVSKSKAANPKPQETVEIIEHLAPVSNNKLKVESGKWKVAGIVIAVLAGLGLFWYKTNSFPIIAMVGMKPVTRWEINKMLYSQYGKEAVDNKVTEMLVATELNNMGVLVSQQEIQAKVDEIKASLGEGVELTTLLADRGMSQKEFEKQLELQLRVEKALTAKIEISDEEVNEYLEANSQFMNASGEAATVQAKEAIKYSKLQEEVNKWIEELKAKGKVWRAPGI